MICNIVILHTIINMQKTKNAEHQEHSGDGPSDSEVYSMQPLFLLCDIFSVFLVANHKMHVHYKPTVIYFRMGFALLGLAGIQSCKV